MKRFLENLDGVHLASPFFDASICGDGEEGTSDSDPLSREPALDSLKSTEKKTVTCSRCIAIIKECKGVRFTE